MKSALKIDSSHNKFRCQKVMNKLSIKLIGLLGMFLFIPSFLFTFAEPQTIENSARGFIEWKLKKEAIEKIDAFQLPKMDHLEALLGQRANQLKLEAEAQLASVKAQLKADTPKIIATQIAKMRNLNCECRIKWENKLTGSLKLKVLKLETTRSKLVDFTQQKYMEIVVKLTDDVRIFLGTNVFIFLFIFAVSFLKPTAVNHLIAPSALMVISTSICSYFYLFEQNWFYTIIYNDYTGFGFIAYLLFVFATLCDIAFNKGRVTTEVLNALLNAIGSSATVIPC